MRSRLLIISHTEHYKDDSGNIVGWGPTVRELNSLAKEVEHIYHVACFHPRKHASPSSIGYTSPNITFVPIPSVGGPGLLNKLRILVFMPVIIYRVIKWLAIADAFQFRAPTSMGVYVIPILTLFTRKRGWFKYAGNWAHKSPPLSYRFQRFWLKHCQRRKVTINGRWRNQPNHCITFENPCLTNIDRQQGLHVLKQKKFDAPLTACFAGRLEDAKGVRLILDVLKTHSGAITKFYFIGDGRDRNQYEEIAKGMQVNVIFCGFMTRVDIFKIFTESHLLFLPSTASEGFPKVIAEAANFGCVPVVSNVSSIPQYIDGRNGFVWNIEKETFSEYFKNIKFKSSSLEEKGILVYQVAEKFTFEYYASRVLTEIL